MKYQPAVDATYLSYAELLLRRHALMVQSQEDDPEVEDIEERLVALWEQLDEAQRQSLNGAGSDLNWVSRHGAPPPNARRAEDVTENDRHLLAESEAAKDWHATLHLLRVCSPVLDTKELASRRAEAYAGLGLSGYESACRALGRDESLPTSPGSVGAEMAVCDTGRLVKG